MRYVPHTSIVCIDYKELVPEFMTVDAYDSAKRRKAIRVHGYGGNGRIVSIEVDSLLPKYKAAIIEKYGDLHEYISRRPIMQLLATDHKARQFFANHILPNGRNLDLAFQQKYVRQAEWLNMLNMVLANKKTLKEVLRIDVTTFWQSVIDLHQEDKPVKPELPVTEDNLRKLLHKYNAEGYESLVSKRFGNQNTRKVTDKIENLIFSLHNLDYKPTMADVCRKYKQFINGDIQVVDTHPKSGGELFNPQDFYVKGEPYALAESTVQFYLKKMANIIATHSQQIKRLEFNNLYRPYVIRKAPMYAFSKLSMDDRDLPFKDLVGDRSAKTYQIIDVASGCIVGKAYGIDKNVELIRAAFRDMYQTMLCNGWGFPAEMEMEKHLTSHMMGKKKVTAEGELEQFENDVLTAGNLFDYVRVCKGGNAPEKRAEHVFRHMKYQFNNRKPGFIGRFYAKSIVYRFNEDKAAIKYKYEQIIQNDIDDIDAWNNSLHPKQDQYPGMTRWDVLENCQNPDLAKHPASTIMRYIGFKTQTSIARTYVEVQHNKYRLPDLGVIAGLNNKNVDAYYIPGDLGIEKVYIYQGDRFIAECTKVDPFQEAAAEQTDADMVNARGQWGYQKGFDKFVRENKERITPVEVVSQKSKVVRPSVGVFEEVEVASFPRNDEPVENEYDFITEPPTGDMASRARMAL